MNQQVPKELFSTRVTFDSVNNNRTKLKNLFDVEACTEIWKIDYGMVLLPLKWVRHFLIR